MPFHNTSALICREGLRRLNDQTNQFAALRCLVTVDVGTASAKISGFSLNESLRGLYGNWPFHFSSLKHASFNLGLHVHAHLPLDSFSTTEAMYCWSSGDRWINRTPIPNTGLLSMLKVSDQTLLPTTEIERSSEGLRRIGKFTPNSGFSDKNMNTPSTLMSLVSPSMEP